MLRSAGQEAANQWFFAVTALVDSAALVWPCRMFTMGLVADRYFELDTELQEPKCLALWQLDDWVACDVVWRSWTSQKAMLGDVATHVKPGIRPFVKHGPDPLFALA